MSKLHELNTFIHVLLILEIFQVVTQIFSYRLQGFNTENEVMSLF